MQTRCSHETSNIVTLLSLQAKDEIFNRASLMNIGYLEARKSYPYDCYVFHDVDLIPENSCNVNTVNQ